MLGDMKKLSPQNLGLCLPLKWQRPRSFKVSETGAILLCPSIKAEWA